MGYVLCVVLGTVAGIVTISLVTKNGSEEQLKEAYDNGYKDGMASKIGSRNLFVVGSDQKPEEN